MTQARRKEKTAPCIALAEDLSLPLEAVTQTFGILAIRGVGKTYTASVLAEGFLEAGQRVIVSDPVGVWWGLRIAADGKLPGLPILILGGDHADVPLRPEQGQIVAELVVDENLSVVLDLSHFRKAETTRFMTDFCETLYHRNRQPAHLILDEADVLAPQRPLPGQQRLLGAVEDLVRRGRARGLGTTLITQRPAVLNKDVLTQVEALITLRLIAPQDRAAIEAWIRVHGTPEEREELMRSLPSLPVGTAWFWSPGWLKVFQQIVVRRRHTFDSSATPKVGQKVKLPAAIASVDVAAMSARLAERLQAASHAEAPSAPARRRRDGRTPQESVPERVIRVVERVEVPVVSPEALARLETLIGQWIATGQELLAAAQAMQAALARAEQKPRHVAGSASVPMNLPPPALHPVRSRRNGGQAEKEKSAEGRGLRAGERRLLEVLARHYPMKVTRAQLGTLARYTASGGTFGTYFGNLKRQGLLEETNGEVRITEAGLEYLGSAAPREPQTTDEILAIWRSALRAGERAMLDALVAVYPKGLLREELAERTGYAVTGGTFGTYLGSLRRNGLVTVTGDQVCASKTLFLAEKPRAVKGQAGS